MSICIENCAQNSQKKHSFLSIDGIFTFSQGKLSKRFQFQTNEISNFIVASLDIRFNFSNESKSEKQPNLVIYGHFQHLKMNTFSFYFAILFNQMSHFKIEILPRNFPQTAKSLRLPRKCNNFRNHPIEQKFPFESKFNPKNAHFKASSRSN